MNKRKRENPALQLVPYEFETPWKKRKIQPFKFDLTEEKKMDVEEPMYRNVYSTMPRLPARHYAKRMAKRRTKKRKSSRKSSSSRYGTSNRMGNIRIMQGRGAYRMNTRDSFGTRWGGYAGSKLGEFVGGGLQSLVGLGDYSVKRNVLLGGNLPQVVNNPSGGGTIIRFQEYLGDVITSPDANSFDIQSFLLNAANNRTFPFLSQIASNYEQFDFEGLLFEFKSTSADALNSVNTALGTVMLATQYDVLDTPFVSKLGMLNYEFSTAVKPSESCLHMIECAPRQTTITELYTLFGSATPETADPRMYFLGRFHVATTGFQGTSVNIGQLHCTYQVRLLKPKLFVTLGNANGEYRRNLATTTSTAVYTDTLPLGTVAALAETAQTGANVNIVATNIDITQVGTTLTFPPTTAVKFYRIICQWSGDTAVAVVYPVTTFANCTQISLALSPLGGQTGSVVTRTDIISTTGNGLAPLLTYPAGGTLPTDTTNASSMNVTIAQMPPIGSL